MVNTTNAHYRSLIEYDPWNSTSSFVIKVNSGSNSQFTISTKSLSGTYNYNVVTSDGQSFTGLTVNKTIIFPSANTNYFIEISGDFPHLDHSSYLTDRLKIRDIMQWGDIKWSSMDNMFRTCSNLTSYSATDNPDLSNVTSMGWMFYDTPFNGDISGWDVSNVKNMGYMFTGTPFNQDISGWNVGNVTNMSSLFSSTPFNQNISGWYVGNVTDMSEMFQNSQFNQNISGWSVARVNDMREMFMNSKFNQNISGWNVDSVIYWYDFRSGSPLSNANTPPKFL